MKRVLYLDGSNSRLTRGFLDLRAGDGTLGERVVELYLPTQSALPVVEHLEPTHFAVCSLSCCSRNVTRAMSSSALQVDMSGGFSSELSAMVANDCKRRVSVYWQDDEAYCSQRGLQAMLANAKVRLASKCIK